MERDIVEELYELILDRKKNMRDGSYTCQLYRKGKGEILKKVGEESIEVILAAHEDKKDRLVCELADLLYHLLVLMAEEGVTMGDVSEELVRRRGKTNGEGFPLTK
jgi:phosphoribosyl-ATP pyrophosphohydrolase